MEAEERVGNKRSSATPRAVAEEARVRPPWMAEVPGAKPSVNEASFTGQAQEQFFRHADH
jgi:hypothetical protein